ncbi:hypothetical protein HU001_13430 [Staphylococcus sp. SS21]|nr:hypothetical protein [Staphylococcus singaporensis]
MQFKILFPSVRFIIEPKPENKFITHNNEYYTKQRELSRYIDGKRRENDIQNIEIVGAVNIIEPFNV